jgi:hypothetical protein
MALSIYSISFQMERTVMTWAPSLVCLIDWLHVWAFDLGTQIERCLFFFLSYLYPEKKKEVEIWQSLKKRRNIYC